MDLALSHVGRLPRALRHVAELRVQTHFVEVAPGLSIIRDICARTLVVPRRRDLPPQLRSVELQRLTQYAFAAPPPGVVASRQFLTPSWREQQPQPRSALWCAQ